MTKKISIKEFSPKLQRAIHREVSRLKNPKRVVSKTELSEEAKAFLDTVVGGRWTQRKDGKIDVEGSITAFKNTMLHLFMGKEIFFGNITRNFYCYSTKITSLEGSPEKVGGDFRCSHIDTLTSLKGAPKEVEGNFVCEFTEITSLIGAPEKVGKDFRCFKTKITSLVGAPKEVGGSFYCINANITSLKGSPKEVGGSFLCADTKITSLEGSPEKVGGDFRCSHIDTLTSLVGAPKEVGGNFDCSGTNITSLDGIGEVKGRIHTNFRLY